MAMDVPLHWWIVFNVFILVMLALDLGVFHRHANTVRLKEAIGWSIFWVVLALLFNLGLYCIWPDGQGGYTPGQAGLAFFTGYVIERALSIDNIFIFAGVALIKKFHWTIYIFGVFLILTGIKMGLAKGTEVHPERNPVLKLLRRFLPVSKDYVEGHFLTRIDGRLLATPLFIVLMMVETTDLVFAIDSIPAILAITTDSFIVYTSNIFAILGLRALYFDV